MKSQRRILLGSVLLVLLGSAACEGRDAAERTARVLPKGNQVRAQEPMASERAPDAEQHEMRDLDEGPPEHVTYRPDEIEWQPGPSSFEEGAQFAVLEGDPGEPGVFTLQLKVPDGFVVNPHWHPNVERLTVLSGTLRLGHGSVLDAEAAESLPAGTYTSMPKEMTHYAIADGETIIQLTSVGPWDLHYVNPEDDPRLAD